MTERIFVSQIEERHRPQWREAYRQYAAFYETKTDAAKLRRLWYWLTDYPPQVFGLAAENKEGELFGIAHWRIHPHPLAGRLTAYLDDLFVFPQRRGCGAGKLLIAECARRAKKEGCRRLRWATAESNAGAKKLYDAVARRTDWVIYDLDIKR